MNPSSERNLAQKDTVPSRDSRPAAWSYFGLKLRARPATSRRVLTWPNAVTALRSPFIPAMIMAVPSYAFLRIVGEEFFSQFRMFQQADERTGG